MTTNNQHPLNIAIESLNETIDLLDELETHYTGANTKQIAEGSDRYELTHQNAENRNTYYATQWEAVSKASSREITEAEERAADYSDGEHLFGGCDDLSDCIGRIAYFLFFIEEENEIAEDISETIEKLETYENQLDDISEQYDTLKARIEDHEDFTDMTEDEAAELAEGYLELLEDTAGSELDDLRNALDEALEYLRD